MYMNLSAQTLNDAIRLTDNEQYEAATAAFRQLIAKEPANATNYYYFGENYLLSDNDDSAVVMFDLGAKADPTSFLPQIGHVKYLMDMYSVAETKRNSNIANDDYLKVTRQSHSGFAGAMRITIEAAIALAACFAVASLGRPSFATSLVFPVFKDMAINFGWFFPFFAAFVIVGAGNAVNLTDGLDGLAIGPVMIASASFVGIAYLTGNAVFADYLQIHFVPGAGELAVVCGAVIGAGLGFLWFNAPPASIFMGDTGSLALGGLMGSVAVATKHEIALAIIGGLFVLEAVSVVVQVVSFKLTGKRVFRMAPIHHHFEQLGWTESQIVIRFWIIAIVLALAGLATLKLR